MDANEINAVIDKICEKLGIASKNVEQLIPSIQKLGIISSALEAASMAIMVLAMWYICKRALAEKHRKEEFQEDSFSAVLALWIACGAGAIFTIVMLENAKAAIEWMVTPDAKAVVWLMNQIGGA